MAVFYTDTGSFGTLNVTETINISGSINVSGSSQSSVDTMAIHSSLEVSGSLIVSGSGIKITGSLNAPNITGSLQGTASWARNALTASSADFFNVRSGVVITGSLNVLGTASFQYVNTIYETASIIYSSGSNQFGDATNDIQTLIGTVIISGSQQITGSLNASNIIGSLQGTSSWATNALTASYVTASNIIGTVSSASYALTASSADYFNIRNALTASNLRYPISDGTQAGQVIQTDASGLLSFGDVETVFDTIYNAEATSLIKGTPVYVSGSQGSNPKVYRADAAIASKMPVIYVVSEEIISGNTGRGIALGHIEGIDLTGYSEGTTIYVAEGGGWTSTRPTGVNTTIQFLGLVTKAGNGGKGLVLNPGPVVLPNLQSGYMWVGNGNNYPIANATSSIINVVSSSYASTSSYATNAGNASTIDISSFGSNVDSYLLISNVIANTGIAVGGDTELRYNASTNKLSLTGTISATSVTASLQGTASWANNALTSSYVTASNIVGTVTSASYAATSSLAPNYVLNSATSSFVTNSQTSSFVTNSQTSSFVTNSQTSSFAITGSNNFNGNQTISGSLSISGSNVQAQLQVWNGSTPLLYVSGGLGSIGIGTTTLGNEANIYLGAKNTSEGGQIGFLPGTSYTTSSFIDSYQDKFRILKGPGSGVTSNALVAQWDLGTLQYSMPAYTSTTAYSGTPVAGLGVDSSGNVITTAATGYVLSFLTIAQNLAANLTYYFGNQGRAMASTAGIWKVYVPQTGTIKKAYFMSYASTTAGSAENVSLYIRINNTSDTLVATVGQAAASREFSNTSLNISVTAGDYIEMKFVTPNPYATPPAGFTFGGTIYIQ